MITKCHVLFPNPINIVQTQDAYNKSDKKKSSVTKSNVFGPHPHRAQLLGKKESDDSSSSLEEDKNALSEARKEGKSLRLTKTPLVELAAERVSKSESESNGLTDATC